MAMPRPRFPLVFVWLIGLSCAPTPANEDSVASDPSTIPSDMATKAPIADRDWELVTLREHTNPRGTQDRPLTLRLNSEDSQAGGFAGCNGYGARYTLRDDSISFEAPISTKMFCEGVQEVESAFLGALPNVTAYSATDSTLTLLGRQGQIAVFYSR
jgi:heat shock protein HslJ